MVRCKHVGNENENNNESGSYPLVHSYACVAVHSALEVGLLRAKMRGLSLMSAISSHTAFVKDPPCALGRRSGFVRY